MKKITKSLVLLGFLSSFSLHTETYDVVQVYTQDELNTLIKKNQHLQRVKADDCQLVEDIKAHALKVQEPSYVFLWGDMLTWGVCVEKDVTLGMHFIHQAAQQGLLAAIEQLGRYYNNGTLMIQDKEKATRYFREAALQGNLPAKISYVTLLNEGYGSPVDYEEAYHALYNTVFEKASMKRAAEKLLASLATKMPSYAIDNAKRSNEF